MKKWKDIPDSTYGIVGRFPDGFEMTYVELWDLGKPSEERHWELSKELTVQHGGSPVFYKKVS